jgi:hypothetical protein
VLNYLNKRLNFVVCISLICRKLWETAENIFDWFNSEITKKTSFPLSWIYVTDM